MTTSATGTRYESRILVIVLLTVLGPPAVSAADAGQNLDALLGELRQARATELAALRAASAADEAKEPGADIEVILPEYLEYNPARIAQLLPPATITVRLQRRGGRWLPGSATGWTEGEHHADASGLTWSQGRLAGTLRLRFDPRAEHSQCFPRTLEYTHLPTQTAPFTLETVLDLRPSGEGKLAGTYRRAAQNGFLEAWDEARAVVRTAPTGLPPDPPAQTAPDREMAAVWRQLAGLEWMRLNAAGWDQAAPRLPELAPVAGDAPALAALAALGARARAALADRAAHPVPDYRSGPGGCDDPDFGPWFADEALPSGAAADAVLPADAGGAGPQEWRFIGRWHVLLQLPGWLDLRTHAGVLPPVLADPRLPMRGADGKEYTWRTVGASTGFGQERQGIQVTPPWIDPLVDWTEMKADPPDRYVTHVDPAGVSVRTKVPVSNQGTRQLSITSGTYLAVADLEAPQACALWLGTAAFALGDSLRLYLNERLIWESDHVADPSNIRGALMRVTLRPGVNRLLVHGSFSRYTRTYSPFLVAFCARGAPRSAAEVEAAHARQRAAVAAAEQARRDLRGYLTDWRGQHPDADPVRAWDVEKGINVLWRRELSEPEAEKNAWPPGGVEDSANVLVVGKKVLVTGFPHVLTCLDADTGAVLWRRVSSRFDFLNPPLGEEAERVRFAAEDARTLLKGIRTETEKAKLQGQIAAWQALLDRLGDVAGNGRKVTWSQSTFPWWHTPAWAAPVSDGKWVWVKFGTGVAACYDLEGNRRWMVRTWNPIVGERCSPVLVDGLLVLMLPRRHDPKAKYISTNMFCNAGTTFLVDGDPRNYELVALDAATGEERWRTPVLAGGNEGSPIVAHAANGNDTMALVVTPCGTVVRAADGKVLAARSGPSSITWDIPYHEGDRLCWTAGCGSIVSGRLVMRDHEHVAIAPSWLSYNQGQGGAQQAGTYYIAYNGRICKMNPPLGQFQGPPMAAIMDLATGATVHRINQVFPMGGWTYTPHVAARDVLLFAMYRARFLDAKPPYYNLAVCSQGERPRVLAHNSIPLTKAPPVCVGDRIYLRCHQQVLCLGRVGADGAAYERLVQARHLVKETIPLRPPAFEQEPVALAPDPTPIPDGVPTWRLSGDPAPPRWLFAGPFPPESPPFADAPVAPLVPGQKLTGGKVEQQVVELAPKTSPSDIPAKVVDGPPSLAYYYTVVLVTRPCVVQLGIRGGPKIGFWLSGRRVAGEGALYRLAPGYYPWLLAVTIHQLPPPKNPGMGSALGLVSDWTRVMEVWREKVAGLRPELLNFRPELLKIIATDPDSEEAAQARAVLKEIEGRSP